MLKYNPWLLIALLSLTVLLTNCEALPAPPQASSGPTEVPAQAPAVGVTKDVASCGVA